MSHDKTKLLKSARSLKKQQLLRDISLRLGPGSAGLVFGAALAADLKGFAPDDPMVRPSGRYAKPDWRTPLYNCTEVNDRLSFDDAFRISRNAEGRHGMFYWHGRIFHTLYKQEAEQLDREERAVFDNAMVYRYRATPEYAQQGPPATTARALLIYDEAPQSEKVNDELEFKDAFVIARDEVGPGGFFNWRGSGYQTFSREEWALLSNEQQDDFNKSLKGASVLASDVGDDEFEIIELNDELAIEDLSLGAVDQLLMLDEGAHLLIEQQIENDRGLNVSIGIFLENDDVIVRIDWDGDAKKDKELRVRSDGSAVLRNGDGSDVELAAAELGRLILEVCELEPNAKERSNT